MDLRGSFQMFYTFPADKERQSETESQISNLKFHLKSEITNLIACAMSCSRQVRGWADSLQNSDIAGQRHLNDKTRQAAEDKKRAEAFNRRLLLNLPPGHPLRKQAEERGQI